MCFDKTMKTVSKENRSYFMGIAIVLVILHHLCLRCESAWQVDPFPFSIFYWGQIGVDVFFFVSAYGCCASWEKNSWWLYLLRRIKRIYPQYILFLLMVLVWFYADSSVLHGFKMAAVSLVGIAPLYRMGVNIEWYTPSLLMMYTLLSFSFYGTKSCAKEGTSVNTACRGFILAFVTKVYSDLLRVRGKMAGDTLWRYCISQS